MGFFFTYLTKNDETPQKTKQRETSITWRSQCLENIHYRIGFTISS